MEESTKIPLKWQYILACVLIGGIIEYISLASLISENLLALVLSIILGIFITTLIASGFGSKLTIVTKGLLLRRAFFIGLLAHIFIMIFYFQVSFLVNYVDFSLAQIITAIFYGILYGVIVSVITCWIFVPLYYVIGYFILKPTGLPTIEFEEDDLDEQLKDDSDKW